MQGPSFFVAVFAVWAGSLCNDHWPGHEEACALVKRSVGGLGFFCEQTARPAEDLPVEKEEWFDCNSTLSAANCQVVAPGLLRSFLYRRVTSEGLSLEIGLVILVLCLLHYLVFVICWCLPVRSEETFSAGYGSRRGRSPDVSVSYVARADTDDPRGYATGR